MNYRETRSPKFLASKKWDISRKSKLTQVVQMYIWQQVNDYVDFPIQITSSMTWN